MDQQSDLVPAGHPYFVKDTIPMVDMFIQYLTHSVQNKSNFVSNDCKKYLETLQMDSARKDEYMLCALDCGGAWDIAARDAIASQIEFIGNINTVPKAALLYLRLHQRYYRLLTAAEEETKGAEDIRPGDASMQPMYGDKFKSSPEMEYVAECCKFFCAKTEDGFDQCMRDSKEKMDTLMAANGFKWWGYDVMRAEALMKFEIKSEKTIASMTSAKEKYTGDVEKCYYYVSRYALLYLSYGQYSKALEWCQKAVALYPNVFIRAKLIECFIKLKQMDNAMKELKQLMQDVKKGWNCNRVTNKQEQTELIKNVDLYAEKECQFIIEWLEYIKSGYGQKSYENIIKLADELGAAEYGDWQTWDVWRSKMEDIKRFQILPLHTSIAVFHEHFVNRKVPYSGQLFNGYMSTLSPLSNKKDAITKGVYMYDLVLAQAMICWPGTAVFTDDYSMHPIPMQIRNFMLSTKDDLNVDRGIILRYVLLFEALLVKRSPAPLDQLFSNDASSIPQFEGIYYDLCSIANVTPESNVVLKGMLEEMKKPMPALTRETEWLVFSANVKRMTDDSSQQDNFEFVFNTFSKLLIKTNGKDRLSLALFGDYLLGINRPRVAIVFLGEVLRLYPELRTPENMAVLSKYGYALTCLGSREYMYTASRILRLTHLNTPSKASEWKDSSKATDLADVRDTNWKPDMETIEQPQHPTFALRANPVTASGIMTYLQLTMLNLYDARIAYFQTDKNEKRGNKWCLISNLLLNLITGSVDNKSMKECADALKRACGDNAAASAVWNSAQSMFEATVALGKKEADGIKKRNPKVTACIKKVVDSKELGEGTVSPHEYAIALMIAFCAARWCDLAPMVKSLRGAWEPLESTQQTLYSQLLWNLYGLSEDENKEWNKEKLFERTGKLLPSLLKPNTPDELKQALQSEGITLPDFDTLVQQQKFMELSFEGKINDAMEKSKNPEGPYLINIAPTNVKEADEKSWFEAAPATTSGGAPEMKSEEVKSAPVEEEKVEQKEEKPAAKTKAKATPVATETQAPPESTKAPAETETKSAPIEKEEKKEEVKTSSSTDASSMKAVSKPDPNAYKKVSIEDLIKWATDCENTVKNMRTEGKDKIKQWDVNKTADFIAALPFYGHSDYYRYIITKHQINGAKLLGTDLRALEEWGFDHLAHRARVYSEVTRINRLG